MPNVESILLASQPGKTQDVFMSYRGHVANGVVVLEGGASLPDGTPVRVERVKKTPGKKRASAKKRKKGETLSEMLMRFSGTIKGLPPDFSVNHDHYLYGTSKR